MSVRRWVDLKAPAEETGPRSSAREDAVRTGVTQHPDWAGLAILTLSVAVGLALVLLAAATFIRMVRV